jgi:hypothetical protein
MGIHLNTLELSWACQCQCFGVNDGDACGCRDSFENVVAATLSAIRLRVKTLGLSSFGDSGTCCIVTSFGALPWSLDFLSFLSALVASLMFLLFLLFIFDLLVRGSPRHYVSVWPFGFIYKTEESLFGELARDGCNCSWKFQLWMAKYCRHYRKNVLCRANKHCRAPAHIFAVRQMYHARQLQGARQRHHTAHGKGGRTAKTPHSARQRCHTRQRPKQTHGKE